ncbi:MAG: N-acetyltransferase, partial [Candidatus Methylomirabilales bacterium]
MVIRPVRYPTELRIFQSLPWAIYRDDPHWVPPLLREERRLLNGEHPFFEQAAKQAFLLWEGKEAIGRICAIHDRHHLAVHGDGVGFFGFFECRGDVDAARVLLDTARAWLR